MVKARKDAVTARDDLSEIEQEELFKALLDPRVRERIDAMLARAKARGGETSNDDVFAELRAKKYCR